LGTLAGTFDFSTAAFAACGAADRRRGAFRTGTSSGDFFSGDLTGGGDGAARSAGRCFFGDGSALRGVSRGGVLFGVAGGFSRLDAGGLAGDFARSVAGGLAGAAGTVGVAVAAGSCGAAGTGAAGVGAAGCAIEFAGAGPTVGVGVVTGDSRVTGTPIPGGGGGGANTVDAGTVVGG